MTNVPQRSSMENFLDDYQTVRLIISLVGLALLMGVALFVAIPGFAAYAVGLSVTGGHAVWCRLRRIRSPRAMLLLDLTLWGAIPLISDDPVVNTGVYAFLLVLAALYADRYWLAGLVIYVTGWYGVSYFREEQVTAEVVGAFLSVLLITGGLAAVMYRVRVRLGQLDGNRSQMLGTVSHELRNTLTGIVGLTEIVSSASDLEPEEARELIGLAHRQAVDATEIVEDMLTATSMERSALTVEEGAIDFNHEVVTTVRRFVGLGTAVGVDLGEAVPMARGDALRVRQIIRNLVSNAVRYGGETIVVSTRADGDRVQVIVADDGDGVLPEDESSIFLPYRRSTNTRRDASSVGLGLWICGQLAVAMGGTLTYRRLDNSTQFVLALAADGDDSLPARSEPARGLVLPKSASTRSEGQVVPVVAF